MKYLTLSLFITASLPATLPEAHADVLLFDAVESAPANAADSLHGELLLVHGTSDDNVHLQNAMHMADALINAGKQFQMMFYPYQPHGIITPSGRHHERRLMFNFLEQHLKDQATGQ